MAKVTFVGELQDDEGNAIYPHSEASVIWCSDGENVQKKISHYEKSIGFVEGKTDSTEMNSSKILATSAALFNLKTEIGENMEKEHDCTYGVLNCYEPFAYSTSTLPMPIIGSALPLTDGQLVLVQDEFRGFYGSKLDKFSEEGEFTAGIYRINTPVEVTSGDDNRKYYTFESYTRVGDYTESVGKKVSVLEEELASLDAGFNGRVVDANRKPAVLDTHSYNCGICENQINVITFSNGMKLLKVAGTINVTLEKGVTVTVAKLDGTDRPVVSFERVINYRRGETVCRGMLSCFSTGEVKLTPYNVEYGGILQIGEHYV